MDISNRFSLEDFLAYLFPGVTGTLGIYVLLLLTPLQPSLTNFSNDFTTGIIFLVLSYIVGILLSGISEKTFQYYENQSKIKSYKDTIPLRDELRRTVKKAFTETFKLNKETHVEWCKDYFYLCRSLVIQSMPNALTATKQPASTEDESSTVHIYMGRGGNWMGIEGGL